MQLVMTEGRKSLPLDQWVKAEGSQGASNCVATRLTGSGVQVGDTQNPDAMLGFDAGAWAALRASAS